jgi:PLP dependent protein
MNPESYIQIVEELKKNQVRLVAVSKTKPAADLQSLYDLGQRDFGENYVQEMVEKQDLLPVDIHWHFIGHLQSNKVKYIIPFVHLLQGVDSVKLLKEVDRQASRHSRKMDCLLQVHIGQEETKFGFSESELDALMHSELSKLECICIRGLMGMASFSEDEKKVRSEYRTLKGLFDRYASWRLVNCQMDTLSMGMSGDYRIAIEEGSTMVRIGSLIFGERRYS